MDATSHLPGGLSGKSLARGSFSGSFPFSGEVQGKDGAREISGSISWKTLLPTEELEDGKRHVLMVFSTRDESDMPFGGAGTFDVDFIARLAAKDREAREHLLSKLLRDWKRLENYNIHCA